MLGAAGGGGGLNQTSVRRLVLVVQKLRECATIITQSRTEWNPNKVTNNLPKLNITNF